MQHNNVVRDDLISSDGAKTQPSCRFCKTELRHICIDLGMSPLSNAYLAADQIHRCEKFYPLTVFVCSSCLLVQLLEYERPDIIFSDYSYFSSYSDSWLEHARIYSDMVIDRFSISKNSLVVELASNDGYLLKNFVNKGIPVIGIEPAENVAAYARESGIPTIAEFFGIELAKKLSAEHKTADLIVGNNVLAHVPDINDFVGGIKELLKTDGVATLEFPHILNLIQKKQFDTIYHEHFSYLSFYSVLKIFQNHGLKIFDVDELTTHGGSLRIYATHTDNQERKISRSVEELFNKENRAGLHDITVYTSYSQVIHTLKRSILTEIIKIKEDRKSIVGYGAAAKGNTLMNYCGIRTDMVDYVVDRNPHKIGKLLPGTHIPIKHPDSIKEDKPDYVLILPWNLQEEIITQNSFIREWGGKFIVPIPDVRIID
jgi:SAM-dependent methyltransferase